MQLVPFEGELNNLCAHVDLANHIHPSDRKEVLEAVQGIRGRLLNIARKDASEEDKLKSCEEVKEIIRGLLGINELTSMRKLIISESMKFLKNDGKGEAS